MEADPIRDFLKTVQNELSMLETLQLRGLDDKQHLWGSAALRARPPWVDPPASFSARSFHWQLPSTNILALLLDVQVASCSPKHSTAATQEFSESL